MSETNIKELAATFQKYDERVLELEAELAIAKSNRCKAREVMFEVITRHDLDEP